MSIHEAPPRSKPLSGLARVLDRAIPNPILAFPILLLAVGLLFAAPLRITGDTFFDLVSGRDIAAHGLPHTDRVMAFTAGRRWEDQQWLAHLFDYGLYLVGGLPLVIFTDSGCLVGALVIAIVASRRLGASPMWVAAVASPVMLLLVPSTARAQTFAMPLFALLVWLLSRDARTPDRRILLLLPLLVLWANLHGSILLASGLVVLHAAIGAGRAIRARTPRALARPLGLAVAALLAPLASPYGFQLVSYYRATAASSAFQAFVTEWSGTTLRSWPAYFAFAALALVALLRPEIKLGLHDSLCLIVLTLAGLDTTRNIVWLPIAAVILIPPALTRWSPETETRAWLRTFLLGVALVGGAGVGLLAAGISSSKLEHPFPDAEGNAIAAAAAKDPSARIVTQETFADWLLWRHPELRGRIAFDIRFELLGPKGLKQVVHFEDAAGLHWDTPFRGYRLALISNKEKPELVASLRAQPGARVLAHAKGIYAIERPVTS